MRIAGVNLAQARAAGAGASMAHAANLRLVARTRRLRHLHKRRKMRRARAVGTSLPFLTMDTCRTTWGYSRPAARMGHGVGQPGVGRGRSRHVSRLCRARLATGME